MDLGSSDERAEARDLGRQLHRPFPFNARPVPPALSVSQDLRVLSRELSAQRMTQTMCHGRRETRPKGGANPDHLRRCLVDSRSGSALAIAPRTKKCYPIPRNRQSAPCTQTTVSGCEKPRISGEQKIWGLTSGDDVFSQIGRAVAGSSLPAMNTRCVRTLRRVTRRAGAQRRSREAA